MLKKKNRQRCLDRIGPDGSDYNSTHKISTKESMR